MNRTICHDNKWIIFGACFLWELLFTSLPLADSVYVVPVTEALGFTRAQFTLVFSIRSIATLIVSLFYGKLYSRFRVKPLMVVGSVCTVAGYLIYSQAASLWVFYLAAILLGISGSLMSASSLTIILNSWFDRSVGLVLGIVFTGSSIGGAVLSSLMGRAIDRFGYSGSYLLSALLAVISSLPVLILTYERRQGQPAAEENSLRKSLSYKDFFQNRLIQSALLLCLIIGITVYPVEAGIPAHLTDRGFPLSFGASVLGAALLLSSLGKILFGFLYDRFGLITMIVTGGVCFIAGAFLFICMNTVRAACLFALIFGISIANITTVSPMLSKSILSGEDYGKYISIFSAVMAAGNTVGFAVMNSAFDRFGSYTGTVCAYIVLFAGAMLIFCSRYRRWAAAE